MWWTLLTDDDRLFWRFKLFFHVYKHFFSIVVYIHATHVAGHSKLPAVVSEQEVPCEVIQCHSVTCETVARTDTFDKLHQNAAISEMCMQSHVEEASTVTMDSCQYRELQEICRHLQVAAEIYLFCTLTTLS